MIARVLVIGLGNIGMLYDPALRSELSSHALSHTRAFSNHDKFVLTGGVDPDSDRRSLFEARFGASSFDDIREALDETAPDVVVIASPTSLHRSHVEAVLECAKPRVIICEKPLAATASDAEAMVRACECASVKLFVNYQRRVDAAVVEIRERFKANAIMLPLRGVCWYTKGAMHSASHFADLLSFWLGPVKAIRLDREGRAFGSDDAEPDFTLHFTDAEVAFRALPDEKFSCHEVQLFAANGALRYGHSGPDIEWRPAVRQTSGTMALSSTLNAEVLTGSSQRALYDVAEMISKILAGEGSTLCTGREGAALVATLSAVVAAIPGTTSP